MSVILNVSTFQETFSKMSCIICSIRSKHVYVMLLVGSKPESVLEEGAVAVSSRSTRSGHDCYYPVCGCHRETNDRVAVAVGRLEEQRANGRDVKSPRKMCRYCGVGVDSC
jgi:hypothetical protein